MPFALESILLMGVRTRNPTDFAYLLGPIERLTADAAEKDRHWLPEPLLYQYAGRFPRQAADLIAQRWLKQGTDFYRRLAITALNGMLLRRTAPDLVSTFMDHRLADEVRAAAILAAGEIGGQVVAKRIEDYLDDKELPQALRTGLLRAFGCVYGESSRTASKQWIVELQGYVREFAHFIHGCGFRRVHLNEVEAALQSTSHPLVRGAAGLSMARI